MSWYHTGYSKRNLEKIAVDFMHEKKSISEWGLKSFKKMTLFDKVQRVCFVSTPVKTCSSALLAAVLQVLYQSRNVNTLSGKETIPFV